MGLIRVRRRWILCLLGVLATAVGAWVGRAPLLTAAGQWLDCGDRLQRVDYLLIMPGDQTTRPFAAAALIRHELAGAVLIPRNVTSPQVEDGIAPPTHEIIRRVLTLRGVAEPRIVVLDHRGTNSSWDDLQALADFLVDHPGATAAVLTNDYHTRRTRWIVRRVLGRSTGVLVFGVPAEGFGPHDWWHCRGGVHVYVGEYAKLVVYLLLYGGPLVWTALAVAGLAVTVPVLYRTRLRMAHSPILV